MGDNNSSILSTATAASTFALGLNSRAWALNVSLTTVVPLPQGPPPPAPPHKNSGIPEFFNISGYLAGEGSTPRMLHVCESIPTEHASVAAPNIDRFADGGSLH